MANEIASNSTAGAEHGPSRAAIDAIDVAGDEGGSCPGTQRPEPDGEIAPAS